jgi:hypothetical protein
MTSPLETTLATIATDLDRHGIPYMLIGGYAVAIHGTPRFTQDIDITLGIDTDDFDRLLAAIGDHFTPLPESPRDFAIKTNVLPCKDIATDIRVDLIFSFIDFERRALSEALDVKLAGQRIKVATPTHLIVYKLLAGRPRDLEDAQNVFSCNRQAIRIDIVDACLAELAPLANPAAVGQWHHMKETTP